ncbi:serine hydrolase-like protein 2 isoform X1 [Zootermopsis nevadensis]|uniref:serine hydrolase-like protein 2 isoform X1 n=1 Tax=Zootermopsis nevadensis TaxID=136037 RepID=UPI000B8E78B0|nr:serine hydrolase-like protein 2 isoform X1 [Zootermopsis nevadensis]XP_021917042.1 serine hydrolase-like protein 2 isoform X1 [Zootermopsis nevadensis]
MEKSKDYKHLQFPKNDTSPFLQQTVELQFAVPWGHIAAKAWGDPHGEPILAVHGIDDSASTFDTLIPLLLQLVGRPLYVVCVDLPGHGHSSPLAPGIPYRVTDMFGSLHRVILQLEWHRFHYLGHSLGGLLGYYFVASYPDFVEKLIVFDAVSFRMYPPQYQPNALRACGENLLRFEKKIKAGTAPPSYTLDEALHKLADSRGTKMTDTGIRALASRNLRRVEGHEKLFSFSRDHRIKFTYTPLFYHDETAQIMSQVKCQLLLVIGNESQRITENSVKGAMLSAAAKSCSYFKCHIVDGDHDVHLNFPERVAPLVAKFLCEPMSSL